MKKISIAALLFLGVLFSIPSAARSPLTFEERVKAQEAIERVYYNHRIWPKENPQPKPSFEEMVPRSVIEAKVTDYLKKCNALDKFWQRPIQPEHLQAETDRMAKCTKDPATLKELFAALGDDPYLIAECLARPVLSDRLIRNWYASDNKFHGELKAQARILRDQLTPANFQSVGGEKYHAVTIELNTSSSEQHGINPISQAIKLQDDDFRKALGKFPEAGTISQVEETPEVFIIRRTGTKTDNSLDGGAIVFEKTTFDDWFKGTAQSLSAVVPTTEVAYATNPMATPKHLSDSASPDSWKALWYVPEPRSGHTAVWTGSEMIVWGGYNECCYFNKGGRYNSSTDTWTPTSTGANCPSARGVHTAVWTGSEMIIWGGNYDDTVDHYLDSGGRYNPLTDSWTATPTGPNCPSARTCHSAVWTGTEMIVWGGGNWAAEDHYLNTGGKYNTLTGIWTATYTGDNCPSARYSHSAIWTGTEMIVWGGSGFSTTDTGGKYDPSSDSWTATAIGAFCPSGRRSHTAIWTGKEMIIWGGPTSTNDGGKYDPSSDSWTPTSIGTNCPSARSGHTAVWTGTEMVIWGGGIASQPYITNTGGRYNPDSDSWAATSIGSNCPSDRSSHTGVWTGTEMIVWGGWNGRDVDTGGRYVPSSDSWIATSTGGDCPSARSYHTSVWTGTEMIIWGGYNWNTCYNTGGCYNPSIDAWSATSTGANCPNIRQYHTAVWTGTEMIVWGGYYYHSNGYYLKTGGRYTPSSDSWTATSTGSYCPSGREEHTAIWTGTEMIVWGGNTGWFTPTNTGGRYTPSSDSWTATSTSSNCPSLRCSHTAVWTGTDMIIWGGYSGGGGLKSGGKYAPSTDTWTVTSLDMNCPSARHHHTAIWTGNEMVIWGGYSTANLHSGGSYAPSSDSWTPTSTDVNCPSFRFGHTAVWTGTEMIVWGGNYYDNKEDHYLSSGGRYFPTSDTWTTTSNSINCPSARVLHTAVWTGEGMIVWDGSPVTQNGGIYYPPQASCTTTCIASVSPATGTVPLTVNFTATAAPSNCSGVPSFSWAFGDGGTSAEQNPMHTYKTSGVYIWTLTVTIDGNNCDQNGTVVVNPPPCTITCEASANPTSGISPLTVSFSASAIPLDCTGTPTFAWTFGDGGSSTEQNPSHTYTGAETYTWELSVSADSQSCSKNGTMSVSLIPGDCNGDGKVSISEVQKSIIMFLGILDPACGLDCNGDGKVSIGELQKSINTFLGLFSSC